MFTYSRLGFSFCGLRAKTVLPIMLLPLFHLVEIRPVNTIPMPTMTSPVPLAFLGEPSDVVTAEAHRY